VADPFDRLAELRELYAIARDSIAEAAPDRRAPLIARAESLAAQIEALSPTEKAGDPIDEIAARRAARGGATARSRRPAADQG
jgi:hypothetical protein